MEKIFVITEKDFAQVPEDIFLTKAKDLEEAIVKYSKSYVNDKDFIEDLESRVANGMFWDKFFHSIYITEDGEERDLDYDSVEQYNKTRLELQQNVQKYFGEENKSLSKELIEFYNDEDLKYEDLSEEILNYIGLKEVKDQIQYYVIKEVEL